MISKRQRTILAKRGGGRFRTQFYSMKVNKNNDIKYRYGFCLVAIQRYLVSFFCFRRKGVDSACGNLFPDGVMRAGLLCRIVCEICISDDIYEAAGEWINLVP